MVGGLPGHLSGRESEKSGEARDFGEWLAQTTGLPVRYYDERYTSAQAEELLGAAHLTTKRRQARLDMLAAQIPDVPRKAARQQAMAAISTMMGTLVLARIAGSGEFSDDILAAGRDAVLDRATPPKPPAAGKPIPRKAAVSARH